VSLDSELLQAALIGDVEEVKKLLEKGANPNARDKYGRTPLHWTAARGRLSAVEFLLEKGADPNAREQKGCTPLHWAAYNGRLSVVKLLLEKGADLHAKDKYGRTPLHFAAEKGRLDVFILLLKRGADPNARDKYGRTPLHDAAYRGKLDVVKLLLERGADLHARDKNGRTPLYFAAYNGRLDVVKLLLESGADPNARDKDGKRPVDVAREKGFTDVVELLERWVERRRSEGRVLQKPPAAAGGRVVSIADVAASQLRVGEWGVVQVVLEGRGGVELSVEGDVEWMCEEPISLDGRTEVKVYVKPRAPGRIPVKIVAESQGGKASKLVELDVEHKCSVCGAPVEPGAKYCWNCGSKLAG